MKRISAILKDYGIITVGCLLYAFSYNCFFYTNDLAMGGFTGVAQVVNKVAKWVPVGTMVFCMNVPLMIMGIKKQGWSILFASLYSIFISSLMIDAFDYLNLFKPMDPLLACVFGGIIMGAALAIMLQKNATTGGTELLARLLKYVIPRLSIGKLCLIIDVTVVSLYAIAFGNIESTLYGVIAMYVCSISMDMVIYGAINAKLVYIISEHNEQITQMLMEMGRGATIIKGKGAYTGNEKNIIMCAARPGKIAAIKAAVKKVDPDKAFIIVSDAKEVFGEGFGEYGEDAM